ncbi:cyclin-D3-2 [Brachypodium distachyon]|uniref:Cyclin N-terminal domain-containing protein n=1 Tax=Brachypodium distachyon TaxID=15368 RepID=I1IIS2_BRADI|nr:cyclin-D3-2 [Brachypodium distachyon]KQJ86903.1 hypothetical protein BRADI_4g08357v3 [Brachypodium distachyon]|eukprot:XP_003575570.1 cyclin-D3-2 [Brachypodium distachyon]
MAFAALFADSLYCPEEHLDLFQEPAEEEELQPAVVVMEDEVRALLEALRGKEEELMSMAPEVVGDGGYGEEGREAAVGWAAGAAARLGFSALTAALATAYLDGCFLPLRMRLDGRPWMARLAAVACVALAAKVEETRVPALLDLQLCAAAAGAEEEEGGAYVFDPKTVRRMELLVLSTLAWRMHPVTPFSFLHPLALPAPRLQRCEAALLAAMPDRRWPRHRPSSWAAAALLATTATTGDDAQLLALINAPEDEVAECAKILNGGDNNNKRKRAAAGPHSPPLSPSGVISAAAFFSSESSADSWPPASASSSPGRTGRPLKRAAPDDAWP